MTLADLRKKKGYSQGELSLVTGISKRSIQHYEQGARRIDSANLDTLCTLALALDCTIEDLIEEETLKKKYKLASEKRG